MSPEYEAARLRLMELLPPGSTVTTILRHVARSGMMRVVLPIFNGDRVPDIDIITDYKYNRKHDGFTVHGCGTDAGFELVHNLSSCIYRDGFDCLGGWEEQNGVVGKPGVRCPASDHVNHVDPMPTHHASGGYALRQRWV